MTHDETLKSIAFQLSDLHVNEMSGAEKNICKTLVKEGYGKWNGGEFKLYKPTAYDSDLDRECLVEEVEKLRRVRDRLHRHISEANLRIDNLLRENQQLQ